jgi:hypothetical protein
MKNFFVFVIILFLGIFAASAHAMGSAPQLPSYTTEEVDYINQVDSFETTFIVSSPEVSDAWGRAQDWVAQYSSAKIQICTDYVLQTYDPARHSGLFGYDVVKIKNSDGSYTMKVICNIWDPAYNDAGLRNARILAYYIKTGSNNPNFIAR